MTPLHTHRKEENITMKKHLAVVRCVLGCTLSVALSLAHPLAASAQSVDQRFLAAHGLQPLTPHQVRQEEIRVIERLGGSAEAFSVLAQLYPMAYGLAWVQAAEPELERARYRVQLHLDPNEPELIYLDVLRVNMGPIVRAGLIRSHGRENVAQDKRDRHPHRHWRLVLNNPSRGQLNLNTASAATATTNSQYRCLGQPCMADNSIEESPRLAGGAWQEWTPVPDGFISMALPSPGRYPLVLSAGQSERAYLGHGVWEMPEPLPKDWRSQPLAEMVAELAFGNGDGHLATLCTFNSADDSVRDRCVRHVQVDGESSFSRYASCRRGRPNPRGLCP